ncbi:MAG: phosphoheptose isomerase [Acidobacteria bacterium]|nr:MAG: phosphoheptose isomerase [Acidobacteriota bacterium]
MTEKLDTGALLRKNRAELEAALSQLEPIEDQIGAAAQAMLDAIKAGGKILVAGNGGSAAEAQHLTSELVGRFVDERRAIPALCLHGDSSAVTAISNDYGYERVFARQVEAHGQRGDVLVLLSTSGASANLIEAARTGTEMGLTTIGILGRTRRALHELVGISIEVPSDYQPAVQEMHLFLVHALTGIIEAGL